MRRILIGLLSLIVIVAVVVLAALYETEPMRPHGAMAQTHASEQSFSQIERGRYLTIVGDCAACHTDAQGGRPFAGGRPIDTPFGRVLASNITPDRDTGIGAWSDDDFANALQRGFSRDGHMLYPAMPYAYYTRVTREDVLAIRAYLATVAPIRNAVVADQLPFPFNIRLGMRFWNLLYFGEGRYQPDIAQNREWNRGAYLVQGLDHCGACHTPKSLLGGDKTSISYQGNTIQGWYAPNLTGDHRRGLGSWSVEEVVEYLKTGHNKQASASGPMAEEVDRSTSRTQASDLTAIAIYLKSLAGQADTGPAADIAGPAMRAGQAIYSDSCSSCHGKNGAGVPGLFPTLKASPAVLARDATSLMRVVLDGAKSVTTPTAPTGAAMPSYAWQLDDAKIAAVLTYVRNAWGNAAPAVTEADVTGMRRQLRTNAD
jgi:mono/diheme cytochrome c family protein